MRYTGIAIVGSELGFVNCPVHRQFTPRQRTVQCANAFDTMLDRIRLHHRVHGERACVDQCIARAPRLRLQRDLVERVTGGLCVDHAQHRFDAVVVEGKCVGERLGDGLDGEQIVDVAGGVDRPADTRQSNTEEIGIGFGELAVALGNGPAVEIAALEQDSFQILGYR